MGLRQPVEVDSGIASGNTRQDLQVGLCITAVGIGTTHNKDTTVCQREGGWVPTGPLRHRGDMSDREQVEHQRLTYLESSIIEILLPISVAWLAEFARGRYESDTVKGSIRPSCNVQDSSSLVGEDQTSGAENLIVDVEC